MVLISSLSSRRKALEAEDTSVLALVNRGDNDSDGEGGIVGNCGDDGAGAGDPRIVVWRLVEAA